MARLSCLCMLQIIRFKRRTRVIHTFGRRGCAVVPRLALPLLVWELKLELFETERDSYPPVRRATA